MTIEQLQQMKEGKNHAEHDLDFQKSQFEPYSEISPFTNEEFDLDDDEDHLVLIKGVS